MQIPVAPKVQKNLRFKVGDDNYERHVSDIKWAPSSAQKSWHGGTPDDAYSDTVSESYVATVTAIQDFETADSFVNFCLDHAGEKATVYYKPDADGSFEITAELTIVMPEIGGKVNEYNETTMQFGSTKPTRASAVGAPTVADRVATVDTAGGELVDITGTNLVGIISVEVDGSPVEFVEYTSTKLYLVTPAHAAGAVAVEVTTATGTDNEAGALTYA